MKAKLLKVVTGLFLISILVGSSVPLRVFPFNDVTAEAASTRYKHNHTSYTCYKMSYYVTPAKCKSLSSQTKKLNTISAITNFIGLTGLTPGIVSLVFGSAVDANQVFVNAAKRGKGVQLTYIAHFSNISTDTYSTNHNYVIK
ncbi:MULTISPECIES: bacteriocin 51 precursor BacA [unclassified Enterococcus]|uniref:bacteriocin 51 precursor BacA n=1 Tax=unclassified Enterococcus TaxID=2608891 RepID=UPI003F68E8EC